ncbi:MAG: dihydrolipoamide acetyltransferase family protein [Candidatus Marinimicrobia bacterium]|nr:dihydrolipoamide acetyltransferase family protein [Candidatus Neomarinimicrobiota bacterium]
MINFKLTEAEWPADLGTEGLIAEWKVSEGDHVKKDDILLESVFVKTNIEIPSPVSGIITEICIKKNERFKEGEILVKIDEIVAESEQSDGKTQGKGIENIPDKNSTEIDISPKGTEEFGLTVLERKFLTGIRKTISQRMSSSWQNAPQVTEFINVDLDSLSILRQEKNEQWIEKYGSKVSYEDFIIKAFALSLEEKRDFNSSIINDEILIFGEINIGCAVDTPEGLLLPVIQNANQKTVYEISQVRQELVQKAVDGKLLVEDIEHGTAAVTNLGMTGIDSFTPILNPPQTTILGIGSISPQVVVVNSDILIHQIGRLCLTFDHRVMDGLPAAQFLGSIKEKLEVLDKLL